MADLLLASASPRRRELLEQIGVNFISEAQDIDESVRANETPSQYVERLAREKAEKGCKALSDKALERAQMVGFVILITLMALIFGNDIYQAIVS